MIVPQIRPRVSRGQVVALAVAWAWSLLSLVVLLRAPLYDGESVSSSEAVSSDGRAHGPVVEQVTHQTATLAAVNGAWVVWMALVPLVISLAVTGALWRRRGRSDAGVVAWSAVVALALGTLAALLTIGLLVAPVTAALLVACALHGVHRPG
jgi:hypothetical protein